MNKNKNTKYFLYYLFFIIIINFFLFIHVIYDNDYSTKKDIGLALPFYLFVDKIILPLFYQNYLFSFIGFLFFSGIMKKFIFDFLELTFLKLEPIYLLIYLLTPFFIYLFIYLIIFFILKKIKKKKIKIIYFSILIVLWIFFSLILYITFQGAGVSTFMA